MRTIGEVAESLDLPQHVLRFWETRFKQIDPLKRAGGRRFYRARDIELVSRDPPSALRAKAIRSRACSASSRNMASRR